MDFAVRLVDLQNKINHYIRSYLDEVGANAGHQFVKHLVDSMDYSLFSGGARLRPVLALLTAEALGHENDDVLPLACATELIHTYSLIHDDLPCMDDDDLRRGKPSNHKVFGEGFAVLAGDALSSEAFLLLASKYRARPELALDLIRDLALAAGPSGMAGGQAMDLKFRGLQSLQIGTSELKLLHAKKTGGLLKNTIVGTCKIYGAEGRKLQQLQTYADALGLTFQIADDIADGLKHNEPSFVKAVGLEEAKVVCRQLIVACHEALALFGPAANDLKNLATYVFERNLH